MLAYLRILRPLNCTMAALAVYISSVIAGINLIPTLNVIYAMLAVFFICGAGMIVNDIFDIEIDRINKPKRPLPSGRIKKKTAWLYAIILFAAGTSFSYFINIYTLATAIFASALLILYAWRLKRLLFAKNFIASFLVALIFIFSGMINMNYQPLLFLALLAFLSNIGREIYKDAEDILGDKQYNVRLLPAKYGIIKSKTIASYFILCSILFSFIPYIAGIMNEIYLFFVVIADIVFLAGISVKKRNSLICKIAMIIALLSFFMGAL